MAAGFVDDLNKSNSLSRTRKLTKNYKSQIINKYNSASKRLILLDYDGTLMPLVSNFKDSKPSKIVNKILQNLSSDKLNEVVVVSGRSRNDLDLWLSKININLVAEHGAYIKKAGQANWEQMSMVDNDWKHIILPVLEQFASKTPNAVVEEKEQSLVWHFRLSSPYYANKNSVIIKNNLRPFLKNYNLEIYSGSKILEIRNPKLNKGFAVQQWLVKGYDFILAIGDDYTDEDMYNVLPTGSFSIKIGRGRTDARYRLYYYKEAHDLLLSLQKSKK